MALKDRHRHQAEHQDEEGVVGEDRGVEVFGDREDDQDQEDFDVLARYADFDSHLLVVRQGSCWSLGVLRSPRGNPESEDEGPPFRIRSRSRSDQVNDGEQEDPDEVDEVPVEADQLDRAVVVLAKRAGEQRIFRVRQASMTTPPATWSPRGSRSS